MPYRYGTPSAAYRPRSRGFSSLAGVMAYRPPDGDTPAPPAPTPTGTFTFPWGTASIDPHDTSFGQAPGEAGPWGQPHAPGGQLPKSDQGGPAPVTPKPTSPQGPGAGGGGSWESDPIVAMTRALNAKLVAQAQAAQLAGTKQAQIGYGYDPSLTYADAATREAARQNPYSDLANLLYGHTQRWHQTDEDLNKANLFYGGTRVDELAKEGRAYTLEQLGARNIYQQRVNQLADLLMGAENDAEERLLGAYNQAYERALMSGGGGLGARGRGGGGGINWTSGSREALSAAGYSDEEILAAIQQTASNRGWGPYSENGIATNYGVQQNGQIFHDSGGDYILVKFGTPEGNSTEKVYLPPPASQQQQQQQQQTETQPQTTTTTTTTQPAAQNAVANAALRRLFASQ